MTGGFAMESSLGWTATALVALSYFMRRPATLRRVQALGAVLWAAYGVIIHSMPVIVANIIVITVALGTSLRKPVTPGP